MLNKAPPAPHALPGPWSLRDGAKAQGREDAGLRGPAAPDGLGTMASTPGEAAPPPLYELLTTLALALSDGTDTQRIKALGAQLGGAVAGLGEGPVSVLSLFQGLRRGLRAPVPLSAPDDIFSGSGECRQRALDGALMQALATHHLAQAEQRWGRAIQLQHDLRVPLNVLQLMCESMERMPDRVTPQHLGTLSRNVRRMAELVDGISRAA